VSLPKLRLQTVILSLVIGTLVTTLVIIGFAARHRLIIAGNELKQKYDALISDVASQEVLRLGEVATRTLSQFRDRVEREDATGREFDPRSAGLGECLRHTPSLTWLSYSRARDGEFVGFRRGEGDEVILNESNPSIDGGRPDEFRVGKAGTLEPLSVNLPGGYDPRKADWFRQAVAAKGDVAWTRPYRFHDGALGITAALACVSERQGGLLGVLTADYSLAALNAYLQRLIVGHQRLVAVVTSDGDLLGVASSLPGVEQPSRFLDQISARIGYALNQLPDNTPVALDFDHEGAGATAVYRIYRRSGLPPFVTVVIAPDAEFLGAAEEHLRLTLLVGAGVLVLALLIVVPLSRQLSRPLERVSERLERVAQFHLPPAESSSSLVREISIVADSVDRMTAGLRSFGHYVPTALVRELLRLKKHAIRDGEVRRLTILFADLAGFTSISEKITPEKVVQILGEYFEHATRAIETEHQGTLDKFIGDGVLGFFNAPNDLPDHARCGCLAALGLRDALAAQRPAHHAAGEPELRSRIGLHTGEVLVGNIGTAERFAYTVLGDAANLASRLEALNKAYGTEILGTDAVRTAAGPGFEWRHLDRVCVFGRTGATEIFELLGETGAVEPSILANRATYEAALENYFAGDFAAALKGFEELLLSPPGEHAAEVLRARCAELLREPPTDWAGVHIIREK
jgi:adenylate cyclase